MRPPVRMLLAAIILCAAVAWPAFGADRVKTANGLIEATAEPSSGVRSFKGIPFAEPPVGDLRWKEPQPVKNWTGVRNADQFGPRCMQRTSPNSDYWFRGNGMSEDCLYLNVWTPAKSDRATAAGAGVHLRRRVSERRRVGAALRRREHGPRRHRGAHSELPHQHFWILRPSGIDQGIRPPRVRELRLIGSGSRVYGGCSATSRRSGEIRRG